MIKELKVSPIRAEIKIALDDKNSKQVLQIGEVKLLNEKGEEWGKISNGLVGSGSFLDDEAIVYIQSNFFREPKS